MKWVSLNATEDFFQFELGDDEPLQLVAATSALLMMANHWYISSRFKMQKQETISKMTMNTFVKESARPKILGTSNNALIWQ
jgi:hypothetical protein